MKIQYFQKIPTEKKKWTLKDVFFLLSFVSMILIMIFAEALGLYGLIVAIVLTQSGTNCE